MEGVVINRRLIYGLKTIEFSELKARHWMPPGYGRCRIYADVVVVSRVTYKGTVGVICRDDQGCIIAASALVVPNLKPWKQWLVWRQ